MEEEKPFPGKSQKFQIIVYVIEGRFPCYNKGLKKITVSIGRVKKKIRIKSNRFQSSYYNDFCVFNVNQPPARFLRRILTVKIHGAKNCLGGFREGLLTVWSQPKHQLMYTWPVLADPKNSHSFVRGFLKCKVVIVSKTAKIGGDGCEYSQADESLEPLPGIRDYYRTRIVFCVFRADNFSRHFLKLRDSKVSRPYVKITYCGKSLKTGAVKNKKSPVWNEELSFCDYGPPYPRYVLVEMCDRRRAKRKGSVGNTSINLSSLCGKSFLPTFGPTFLYLYQPFDEFQEHRENSARRKTFTYSCRLLISMRTEVVSCDGEVNRVCESRAETKKTKKKPFCSTICPLNECAYFSYRKFVLFGVVFDVLLFGKRNRRNVAIRLTIGPKKSTVKLPSSKKHNPCPVNQYQFSNHLNPVVVTANNRAKLKNIKVKAGCRFVAFEGEFPCVHVFAEWPDSLRKVYRTNVIKKAIQNCTEEVDKLKCDLEFEEVTRAKSTGQLKRIFTNLSKSCEVILLLTKVITLEDTNLCLEKKRFYDEEISDILNRTKLASSANCLVAEDELSKISAYLNKLRKYAQDPENSFPDTEVWVVKNGKISQIRLRTEDITYSPDRHQRGIMSGKTQTLIIRGDKEQIKAKLDLFLWFGLAEDFIHCLKMLPSGFKHVFPPKCSSIIDARIPSFLLYHEKHVFHCRVYIFQARILGPAREKAINPFARVIFMGKTDATHVKKGTIAPVWNETLIISPLILYGSLKDIKKNGIAATVEVFDKKSRKKLIGRTFVTPVVALKSKNCSPPKLKWEKIVHNYSEVGQILMAAELREGCIPRLANPASDCVPDCLLVPISKYRLEVFFWGVREMKRERYLKNKIFATVKCGGKMVKSQILKNVRKKQNFPACVQCLDLCLSDEPEYAPPISLTLYHLRSFTGIRRFIATSTIPNVRTFCYFPTDRPDSNGLEVRRSDSTCECSSERSEENRHLLNATLICIYCFVKFICMTFVACFKYCKSKITHDYEQRSTDVEMTGSSENECVETKCQMVTKPNVKTHDSVSWWGRYYAARESPGYCSDLPAIKIYDRELECQPEFKGFTDYLKKFDMVIKGKNKNKVDACVAKVKVALKMYKVTCENKVGSGGILSRFQSNDPLPYVVRVYIISGKNLMSKRVQYCSGPYLCLTLGSQSVSSRDEFVPNLMNPTFAKCFQLNGTFPQDHLLHVKVLNRNSRKKDFLIGETVIDLENRYYSMYHASCGLPSVYEKEGCNFWRDVHPPTCILKNACKRANLQPPVYSKDVVVIDDYVFNTPSLSKLSTVHHRQEAQALAVLRRWQDLAPLGYEMVPEHIETRSLYNPRLPGIERGKLEMWIDIFPADMPLMPEVDVEPRSGIPMELRAIVWNVDDVVPEGKPMYLDLYVKGWILSLEDEMQSTDYCKAQNGKGSFNWRFIFRFNYVPSERMMIIKKDSGDLGNEDQRRRCKLEIQIWENDTFGDDYLGTLILELSSMPTGAKLPNRCTLKMLAPNATRINLFKIGRTRGWWPFRRIKEKQKIGNDFELTGKIDLELEVLTKAEADDYPVGKGRKEPQALPASNHSRGSFHVVSTPIDNINCFIKNHSSVLVFITVLLVLLILVTKVLPPCFKKSPKEYS